MKYVSITFDDGRADNFEIAYPIMKKNNIVGTVYCTTGYIDGTWEKPLDWKSTKNAMKPTQLKILRDSGWEVGLHGDKHVTAVDDLQRALRKFDDWKISYRPYGFSMPNSRVEKKVFNDFCNAYLGKDILYIRSGRKNDTGKLSVRFLFACYTILRLQNAYNIFNRQNVMNAKSVDTKKINSIVIRNKDNPRMIINFLKYLPDETWTVLMFHSILPKSDPLYGTDPWNWSSERFEAFCNELRRLTDEGNMSVRTVYNMVYSSIESNGFI